MPPARPAPARATVVLAFAAVYLAWGSTYLAIRIGVASLPPTVLAGARFLVAGAGLLLALRLAGRPITVGARPLARLAVIATLLLIGGNGLVVWAEQTVPSGLAALLVATVPLWMAAFAALPPARERLGPRAVAGLVLGLAGVALLARPRLDGTGETAGVLALLGAALSWSCGSVYARRADVGTDPVTATGWEMLIGGALFALLGMATGAWQDLHPDAPGVLALAYLVVVGSWIGLTAYIWLLAHVPAAKVATYAYVNPVIAVALGWWLADEPVTLALVAGSAVIVVAVALVTSAPVRPGAPTAAPVLDGEAEPPAARAAPSRQPPLRSTGAHR